MYYYMYSTVHVHVDGEVICTIHHVLLLLLLLTYGLWLFSDINECIEGSDECHAEASCANLSPGYTCTCKLGFTGNGFACTGKPRNTAIFSDIVQLPFILVPPISTLFLLSRKCFLHISHEPIKSLVCLQPQPV